MKVGDITDGAPIAYDTAVDMHDLSIICIECANTYGIDNGSALYAGDYWAEPLPKCSHCGREIEGLIEAQSS